jgi:hypothetical protein
MNRLPISTGALVAGLLASAVTMTFASRVAHVPPAVVWLATWACVLVTQVAVWAVFRRRAS